VNKPNFGAPLIRRSQQRRDFLDGIVNLGFLASMSAGVMKPMALCSRTGL
jgi:hypothetical protein